MTEDEVRATKEYREGWEMYFGKFTGRSNPYVNAQSLVVVYDKAWLWAKGAYSAMNKPFWGEHGEFPPFGPPLGLTPIVTQLELF